MLFQYCVPVVATVLAYLLLKEVPTILQIVGIAVTLTGVNLAVRRGKADGGPSEEPDGEESIDEQSISAASPSGE